MTHFTKAREPRVGRRMFMCNLTNCGGTYVVTGVADEGDDVEVDYLKCDRCGRENSVRRVDGPAPPTPRKEVHNCERCCAPFYEDGTPAFDEHKL